MSPETVPGGVPLGKLWRANNSEELPLDKVAEAVARSSRPDLTLRVLSRLARQVSELMLDAAIELEAIDREQTQEQAKFTEDLIHAQQQDSYPTGNAWKLEPKVSPSVQIIDDLVPDSDPALAALDRTEQHFDPEVYAAEAAFIAGVRNQYVDERWGK
jgi:hypothetical protein